MTAPDQCCSNVRKFLPRHASTPLRRVSLSQKGRALAPFMDSDFEKEVVAGTPLGRFGQPDDIARIAVFLASQDSAWLTGERRTASGATDNAAESKAE